MGQHFWACHNRWVGHSHFGTEATKVLWPWLFGVNFDVHSGLLTDTKTWWWPGEYTTLFGPNLVPECHFRAPWSRANSKKWRGSAPLWTPPQGGYPLQIPLCVRFSPQARRKTGGFLRFFGYSSIWLNFTIIILTLFAQVMVSKASATNYDTKIRH